MPSATDRLDTERHGTRLLTRLAEDGRLVFTTGEARAVARELGIPEGYLCQLLSRLDRTAWISRLRRGLYVGTGELPGRAQVHPFAIATHLVSPSAISHWSAMHHHGLTEQVPRWVTAMTPLKVVTPSMRAGHGRNRREKHAWDVGRARFEYVSVKPEHFFGIEEVWVDGKFSVPITDRERTILEGFAASGRFGGMGEVLGILEEQLPTLSIEKLVDYALRYRKGAVVKRLGWALEHLEVAPDTLQPLLAFPVGGYRILDPSRPRSGPYDSRWRIQDNLTPEAASSTAGKVGR